MQCRRAPALINTCHDARLARFALRQGHPECVFITAGPIIAVDPTRETITVRRTLCALYTDVLFSLRPGAALLAPGPAGARPRWARGARDGRQRAASVDHGRIIARGRALLQAQDEESPGFALAAPARQRGLVGCARAALHREVIRVAGEARFRVLRTDTVEVPQRQVGWARHTGWGVRSQPFGCPSWAPQAHIDIEIEARRARAFAAVTNARKIEGSGRACAFRTRSVRFLL